MAICPGLHIRLGEDISQNSSLSSSRSLQYEYSSHHPSTQYGLSAGQAHPGTHCFVQIGSWSSQVFGHALAHLFHPRPPSHSERQRSGWHLVAEIYRFLKWPVVTIFLALFFHAIIFFQIYLGKGSNNCKLSKPKSESRCVKTWLKTARELFEKKSNWYPKWKIRIFWSKLWTWTAIWRYITCSIFVTLKPALRLKVYPRRT